VGLDLDRLAVDLGGKRVRAGFLLPALVLLRHAQDAAGRPEYLPGASALKGARLTEAIDQLLDYLTWRDTKAALVVFVKRKKIKGPAKTIVETVEAHQSMKRTGEKAEGRQRFVFGSRDDPGREIFLTVMVFHIPSPTAQDDDDDEA
jgi:hypothetical protein